MRIVLVCCALLTAIARADAQSTQPGRLGDIRSFELTAVAPPVPAMKYQLTFDPLDKRSGNAAIRYFEAALLLTRDTEAQLEKIFAHERPLNDATFLEAARALPGPNSPLFDVLTLAGESDTCDWQPPLRERGVATLLPHLRQMRSIANAIRYRSLAQVRDGFPVDALASLRLGYQMGQDVAREPVLVGGLVGLGISRAMDDTLTELMSAPDSPNLYWALLNLPRSKPSLRVAMQGERCFVFGSLPSMQRARRGETMSAHDWRSVLEDLARLQKDMKEGGVESNLGEPQMLKEISPAAEEYYARTRKLSRPQVASLDPAIVNGAFFYERYQEALDDVFKLLDLPYPQMREKSVELFDRLKADQGVVDGNPMLALLPNLGRVVETYARADRRLAALTVVEAIRSYAAAHDGKLPASLDDITDTPPPINPRSEQPFAYRIDGDKAILSDPEPTDYPLEFTIRIR